MDRSGWKTQKLRRSELPEYELVPLNPNFAEMLSELTAAGVELIVVG